MPVPTAGVLHEKVAKATMGVYGLKSVFGATRFEDLPFVIPISPISGSPNKVQGLYGWRDDQSARKIRHKVTLMESALELCRRGQAVAYLPTFVAHLHNQTVKPKFELVELPITKTKFSHDHGVFLARRKSDPESPIYRKLAKGLRALCTLK